MSETCAGNTGVWKKSIDDAVALGPANHVPNLYVQFHQFGADFCQALVGAHQCISARLSQCLVPEINIQ